VLAWACIGVWAECGAKKTYQAHANSQTLESD
jgi:hypothetical protein